MPRGSTARRATAAGILSLGLALAGCAGGTGDPGPTSAPSQPPGTPAGGGQASAAPAPTFVRGGNAEANRPIFEYALQQALAADPKAGSHALVDALAAAGFSKSDMEVTHDRTSVDLEADYVIVAVQLDGACLIGQRATSGFASEIAAPLSDGRCLIGDTQPITW